MLTLTLKNAGATLAAMRRYEKLSPDASLAGVPGATRREAPGLSPSVLCLHGFGGVPREVEPVFEVAQELGLRAVAPVLRGHGTVPADLAPTRFSDWLAGVQEEFDALRQQGPVFVIGLSLGAVLASALTLTAPDDVKGLVLLANAFWLRDPFPSAALALYSRLGLPDLGVWKRGSDLGDPEGRAGHVTYGVQPILAASSVRQAGESLRRELFRVHCPTLILHGALDQVCPVANAWRAAAEMTEIEPRVVILPRSRHILTRDVERDAVREEVKAFLVQHVAA